MDEQKEGGMPSYVIVITSVLIAVILIILVGAIILLAMGAMSNSVARDVFPTEDTAIIMDATEENSVIEMTREAQMTSIVEATLGIELTPEGTP